MTVDRQAKAEAKRKQKGLACAKALAKASASLNEYLQACNDKKVLCIAIINPCSMIDGVQQHGPL